MRTKQIWAFSLAAAGVVCSAGAGQPYKCVAPDGKITYTDKKCDAEAQPQKVWDSHLGDTDYPVTFSGADPSEVPSATRAPSSASSATATDQQHAISNACDAKWPGDFRMQEFCAQQQREAASAMNSVISGADDTKRQIIGQCALKWKQGDTYDFRMVKYCYEQQEAARERLGK